MSFNPFAQFTTGPANNAFNNLSQYINQGVNTATPYYNRGIESLQQYGGNALAPLQQNFATANTGTQGLLDLLGLGPGGTQGALKTLEGTPGFQFAKDQGNKSILAQRAATGGTGSGNEAIDLAKFNQGLAGSTYQNAVSNELPFLNLASNTGGQIANTNLGIGGGVQQGFNNLGNLNYGANATIGQGAVANALAQYGASTNQFNALAGLGGGLAGSGLFSGLGSGLMSLFTGSDVKLKEDIEPVGALASGETVYRYRYKGDPRTQIGLIAQEVEGSTPDAVVEFLPDLRAVDYHRATERAAKILEFTRERHEPPPTLRPYAAELLELAA